MTQHTKTVAAAIRAALKQREDVIRNDPMGDAPTAEDLGERWFVRVAPAGDAPDRAPEDAVRIVGAHADLVDQAGDRAGVRQVLSTFAEHAAGFHDPVDRQRQC